MKLNIGDMTVRNVKTAFHIGKGNETLELNIGNVRATNVGQFVYVEEQNDREIRIPDELRQPLIDELKKTQNIEEAIDKSGVGRFLSERNIALGSFVLQLAEFLRGL